MPVFPAAIRCTGTRTAESDASLPAVRRRPTKIPWAQFLRNRSRCWERRVSPTCFESEGNLQIIYNFTQQQGWRRNGVTIDRAGNLYGTTANGGDNSAGFAFKLAHFAGWLLDPLFSFFGGNNGGQPNGVIVGPNGSLYGGAQGGIQNCGTDGSQYCGLVFNLTPQPTACLTALCSWTENVPYRFSSESDGSGMINVSASDQARQPIRHDNHWRGSWCRYCI